METIIDILTCLGLSLIPATFSYFLDYCLGHPMSDNNISTKAVFFRYSYWLAKKALPVAKYKQLVQHYAPMMNDEDPDIRKQGEQQFKLSVMQAGNDYFFYEQAIGLCPFCTNFWICQITAMILFFTVPLTFIHPVFYFIFIPIFSHTILRKL